MDNHTVRPLTEKDMEKVLLLDKEHGGRVSGCIDSPEYVFGLFLGEPNDEKRLIGYCTIGEIDGSGIELGNPDDYVISDVYISEEYRRLHYGSSLINSSVKIKMLLNKTFNKSVFADVIDLMLVNFYSNNGYETVVSNCTECIMKKNLGAN